MSTQFTVSQSTYFDAAHTLRREIETEGSKRIHGHTYRVEVSVRGLPDPSTGMVIDLGILRQRLSVVREQLDHHLLDEVAGLGVPTLENIAAYIANALGEFKPPLSVVRVWRDGIGDACILELMDLKVGNEST
jgi:6-pyruvoyltetrahydropterin/6-carboxytetrahydropterin synthase